MEFQTKFETISFFAETFGFQRGFLQSKNIETELNKAFSARVFELGKTRRYQGICFQYIQIHVKRQSAPPTRRPAGGSSPSSAASGCRRSSGASTRPTSSARNGFRARRQDRQSYPRARRVNLPPRTTTKPPRRNQ